MNAGCASILSGSTQLVTFTSTPDPVHFEIISKSGQVINRLTTPTSIELKRGHGYFQGADLTVRAWAEGYAEKQIPVPTRLNGWYIGNLVFGGLIGLLIVDPATGAMYRFPDQVHINLTEGDVVGLMRTKESGGRKGVGSLYLACHSQHALPIRLPCQ